MVPSPTPAWNFDPVPTVARVDDFWYRKYGEDENGKLVRIAETEDVVQHSDGKGVHLPSPSYWPLVTALGLPIIGYGLLYTWWLCLIGGIVTVVGHLRLGHGATGRSRRRTRRRPRSRRQPLDRGRGVGRCRRRRDEVAPIESAEEVETVG